MPGISAVTTCCKAPFTMAVCISTLCGSPAFAPIGTLGATARGVPCCLHTGESAAMIQVEIPTASIALCTKTAERWQVPQPAVRRTISTFCSLNMAAISGPMRSLKAVWSPPPPMNPPFSLAKSLIYPALTSSIRRW